MQLKSDRRGLSTSAEPLRHSSPPDTGHYLAKAAGTEGDPLHFYWNEGKFPNPEPREVRLAQICLPRLQLS